MQVAHDFSTYARQLEYGFHEKADGTNVPRKHGSDVAMVGYALQQILAERGFLDAEGNQIPLAKLIKGAQPKAPEVHSQEAAPEATATATAGQRFKPGTGKTCPGCGAKDLHKVDGCTVCQHCGHEGGCGG